MSVAAIFDAVKDDDGGRVRHLLRDDPTLTRARNGDGQSVVLLARYHRRLEALRSLLEADPELDIFEASAVGDTERLRTLLDEHPDSVNAVAMDGFFPLGLAAFFNHPESVTVLLERGADVRLASHNPMRIQALHAAVADKPEADAIALATLLLDRGAPVDAAQHGGFTALHAAAQSGYAELAALLLSRGADPNVRLDDGRTPAQLAEEHGHGEIAGRLRTTPWDAVRQPDTTRRS